MNMVQKLAAAEELAGQHKRWIEFSNLYISHRNQNKVMTSIEKALTEMGLWEEYQQIIHR